MSRVLKVDQGDYIINVENGKVVIENDILVKGIPYGTGPIVSNILYVTMDGSDTNDGSAQDPTRACRTVSGAVKSPLYQPGTTIKVAAGHYYEDNPIVVKPYTSIIGYDLRTTSLEPINKTQDLFHVNSSCYIAQLQFINGRSGIVDPNLDRGAYTVAFPINYKFTFTGNIVAGSSIITNLSSISNIVIGMEIINETYIPTGATVVSIDSPTQITISSNAISTQDNIGFTTGKIQVYKSPYIQNCTNQTGPWLYDGAMFVPNQTVQLPSAVGTTTFDNGTTTIVVTVSEGTIQPGMSINTAPQQQGFFSARTLVLANVQLIQEQVLAYIARDWAPIVNVEDIIPGESYTIVTPGDTDFVSIGASSNDVGIQFIAIAAGAGSGIVSKVTYDTQKCRRDIRTIIEHVLFDTTFGGNSKSIQAGLAYWNGVVSYITGEITQTVAALTYISQMVTLIVQNQDVDPLIIATYGVSQWKNTNLAGGDIAVTPFTNNMNIVKAIIQDPAAAPEVYYSTGPETGLVSAEILIHKNKTFIQKEISSYINSRYDIFQNYPSKQVSSERDIGYLVDAIAEDILLGGNSRSIESATAYYVAKKSVLTVADTEICIDAFSRLDYVLQQIVSNSVIGPSSGNYEIQETDATLLNGIITTPSIHRNVVTISNIVANGLNAAPIKYSGTALFSATGVSADNVQQATKVISAEIIDQINGNDVYNIVLDKPTVGIGNNSTLYFGYTTVYPIIDKNIPDRWANRRCDPWGAMGGMLIDGDVVTDNSPVRSFVADAFTQVNQGGRGVRVTNRGYVQLVSVFTIFSSIAVQADNGGIASITNSNANFGTYCMISKGYGPREFSGTVYNPSAYSYNRITNSFEYNTNYQSGFFPNNQQICVFVPDTDNRPHIALVMEVEPPVSYVNAQGKSGFLTATITFATITAGSLSITGIEVDNMYIGQTVYIRDQFGNYGVTDPITNVFTPYLPTGTIISDLGPKTIYFNKPINKTNKFSDIDGDVNNTNYFTLFTCGKAYYTVLSSAPAINPSERSDRTPITQDGIILPSQQITSTSGLDSGNPEIASLQFLRDLLIYIVDNAPVASNQDIVSQVIDTNYNQAPGSNSIDRVQSLINTTIEILKNGNDSNIFDAGKFIPGNKYTIVTTGNTDWNTVAGTSGISYTVGDTLTATDAGSGSGSAKLNTVKKGSVSTSNGNAAELIRKNIQFCVEEVTAFIQSNIDSALPDSNWYRLTYNVDKCRRDVELICVNVAYDLQSGGNYNSVYSGLSYYSRPGTYHIVVLEDSVTDYNLFPDGAIVNFYQRSYMSASGYLFEYVGAGTNYGALPQVGRVDPNQGNEVNMLDGGKVFFTSTDQNGDFRIGPGLVISQATGVLSGRTFQKSLFAEITPFILAIEG